MKKPKARDRSKPKIEAVCSLSECTNSFLTTGARKYCSSECQIKINRLNTLKRLRQATIKRNLNKVLKYKTCSLETCNNQFIEKSRKRFCETKCQQKAYHGPAKENYYVSVEKQHITTRLLGHYKLPVNQKDRDNQVQAELKLELLEAKLIRGTLLSESEYLEEIAVMADKYNKEIPFLLDYLNDVVVEKKTFSYKKFWRKSEDHEGEPEYQESVYSVPFALGYG